MTKGILGKKVGMTQILIKGNVPGAKKSLITIKSAVKAGK